MFMRENEKAKVSSFQTVEEVIEKRLEDIVILLSSDKKATSSLYDDIFSIIERSLIKVAMRRSNGVKTAAARFLGVNRNTLHNKIQKLGISAADKNDY